MAANAEGNTTDKPESSGSLAPSNNAYYVKNNLRVSKDNLFMILALWMEDFVDEEPEKCRKVGAVLVLPNGVVFAIDCTRDDVHAVARLLVKHHNKAEGSNVFMSRKPCPLCAKLLVQSKVKRVLYLPFEPEYYISPAQNPDATIPDQTQMGEDDALQDTPTTSRQTEDKKKKDPNTENAKNMQEVDNIFTASPIAQTKFVLQVHKVILDEKEEQKQTPKEEKDMIKEERDTLVRSKYPSKWMDYLQTGNKDKKNEEKEEPAWKEPSVKRELPWPAYDEHMAKEVKKNFENAMELVARVKLSGAGLLYDFIPCKKYSDGFNPNKNLKQAQHLMTMAKFLTLRTDDPTTGVGAMIVDPLKMEILSLAWNGYPMKALYGEFPRASDKDKAVGLKKYPYMIHAEQNALLMRNRKNIEGAILFVTRTPCHECAPMIAMEGVKTVVVDDDVMSHIETKQNEEKCLDYEKFPNMVKDEKVVCYQTKKMQPKDGVTPDKGIKNLKQFP